MYGTLRGALAGRKIAFDRDTFKATVTGRIRGVGKTIRITAIHVHYDLAVPTDAGEATRRALAVHVHGCPAHQSVEAAIEITWDATLRVGDRTESLRSEESDAATAQRFPDDRTQGG
jgi:uncharacterized OsmC-like protein